MSLKASLVVAVLCLVVAASARPRFVAIPLGEDIRIVELDSPHVRVPRQTSKAEEDTFGSSSRYERQTGGDGHEHVDYGAHTGHHGAFGWYADFPVHAHQ